jgi:hypothetical protein
MDESEFRTKDGGISDVLSTADKRENMLEQEKHASQNEVPTGLGDHCDKVNDKMTNNGHEKSKNDTDSTNEPNCGKISPTSYTEELDLTDPNSVINMLENVDLTEEDTEDLLQEAYKMNRKLKEMLRRQDDESSDSKPKLKSRSKSNIESRPGNGKASASGSAVSSNHGSRNGSSFGIRKVLPPITGEKDTSVYAIKLRRSKTSVQDTKPVMSDPAVPRSKSTSKTAIRKVIIDIAFQYRSC